MKTILVSMLQEHGHLNPSFKLNRTLKARGWDVKYFAIPDFEEHIRSQGFDVVPFLPDLYPRGFIQGLDQLGAIQGRRALTRQHQSVTERLLDKSGVASTIERLAPDAMIIDVNHTTLAYLAWQMGVPTVAINVTLPQTKDPGVPPLRTGAMYAPGLRGKVRAELAWRRFLLKRRVIALATDRLGMCPPFELARRAATRFGYPVDRLDTKTVYFPRLVGTPELILCPEAFDFPRPPFPDRHYVESIDLLRTEPAFPWERIDRSKPIIYLSMGSQRFQPGQVRRFVRRAIEALGTRPDWQAIVALGRHIAVEQITSCPPNVVAVRAAPQLAILKDARVMVTHGGLGSVKECILHGVPMVVLPLAVDQPGNAARIVHHGIGLRGDVRSVAGEDLVSMIDELVTDPAYRTRVGEMMARFEVTEQAERGADVVEQIAMGHRGSRPTASAAAR